MIKPLSLRSPKLTVSMFCLCIFSSVFSTDGWMRSSRGLCWRSWVALGAYVGCLGPLLGPMLAVLGPMLAVLGCSWGLCWRSWAALAAYVGGLGSGSGPMCAVLGTAQGVSWRPWEGIKVYLTVLGAPGRSWERIRKKNGPGSSGKAIWAGIWVEKWPGHKQEGSVRGRGSFHPLSFGE